MEDLKNLIHLVTTHRPSAIQGIFDTENNDLKIVALFNIIRENSATSDEEAKVLIYGEKASSQAYLRLKLRLKDRLLSMLLFIELSTQSSKSLNNANFLIGKNYSIMKTLLTFNAKNLACELAEKTFRLCLKYELHEYGLMFSRHLRSQFGYIRHNKKKYQYYNKMTKKLELIFLAESKSEEYYAEISTDYVTKKDLNHSLVINKLKKYTEELLEGIENIGTYKYCMNTYQLLSYRYLLEKKFELVIETVTKAKSFLSSKPFTHSYITYSFSSDLIIAYNGLNQPDKSIELCKGNLNYFADNSLNWFLNKNILLSLYLFKGNYSEALIGLQEATNNKALAMYEHYRQIFLIKEAYLNFIINYLPSDLTNIQPEVNFKFRLSKFLNDVPLYSKDKSGLNMSIIIIQLLYLLAQKKYSQIGDKLSSLNQYCHRYLRNTDTLRNNIFIKMLLVLPELQYNPIRIQRHVKKLHHRLIHTPIQLSEQSLEVELIPYEKLWEYTMVILSKKNR